jgi:hypothetical protein
MYCFTKKAAKKALKRYKSLRPAEFANAVIVKNPTYTGYKTNTE